MKKKASFKNALKIHFPQTQISGILYPKTRFLGRYHYIELKEPIIDDNVLCDMRSCLEGKCLKMKPNLFPIPNSQKNE